MIVDVLIVAFCGFFVWRGMRRGLVASLTGFVGFVAASAAAVFGYRPLSPVVRAMFHTSRGIADISAALVIFTAVTFAAWFAARSFTKLLRLTKWGVLNAAGGGALSGAWALSWVTVVLLAVNVLPAPNAVASTVKRSRLAGSIVREAPSFATRIARTDLRALLRSVFPQGSMLAFVATNDFRHVRAGEGEILTFVNRARAREKLTALRWDAGLARAALAHAEELYRNGYIAHVAHDGSTPATRARRAGVSYRLLAENIALAPNVAHAHTDLMRSTKHRVNILSPRFTRLGVAVLYGREGWLVVQEFAA